MTPQTSAHVWPANAELAASEAWGRRIRAVGGMIQLALSGFWLIRGVLALNNPLSPYLVAAVGIVVVITLVFGVRAASGVASRPKGIEAKRLEVQVTWVTVIQLAASILIPVLVGVIGLEDWILPSVAITIGPLLLWFWYKFDIRYQLVLGLILTIAPIAVPLLFSGSAVVAATGIGAGSILLLSAVLGFRDLAALRRTARGRN